MLHFAIVLVSAFTVLILLNEAGAFQVCAHSKLLLFFFSLYRFFFCNQENLHECRNFKANAENNSVNKPWANFIYYLEGVGRRTLLRSAVYLPRNSEDCPRICRGFPKDITWPFRCPKV